MKLNNKGFAITTILYGTLILFLMLMLSMLEILSTYKDRLEMLIENANGARDIINYNNIGYFDLNTVPSASDRMTYSINDEVITVTAAKSDGYGYVPYYVDLIKDKNYIFHCDTNGKWYGNGGEVEAYLMLNGIHNNTTTVHLIGNNFYHFKAPASGKYWLRLDVNDSGKTYNFSNIRVLGKKY